MRYLFITLILVGYALTNLRTDRKIVGDSAPRPRPIAEPTSKVLSATPTFAAQQIRDLIPEITKNLHRSDSSQSFAERDQKLREILSGATEADFKSFREEVLDPSADPERRQVGIYLLILSGPGGATALAQIAATPVPPISARAGPHSAEYQKRILEISLRMSALENFEKQVVADPALGSSFDKILATQTEPSLQLMAEVAKAGWTHGHPGKMGRATEAILKSAEDL